MFFKYITFSVGSSPFDIIQPAILSFLMQRTIDSKNEE